MLNYAIDNKPAPRTQIRFHVRRSDGRFSVQSINLDAAELFTLLRAIADRCSAVKETNFENGCVGRGMPPEERFPRAGDRFSKDLVETIEARLNRAN